MMFRTILISLAAAALTGASAQAAATPQLTPQGWGKLKIGMREADAVRASAPARPRCERATAECWR